MAGKTKIGTVGIRSAFASIKPPSWRDEPPKIKPKREKELNGKRHEPDLGPMERSFWRGLFRKEQRFGAIALANSHGQIEMLERIREKPFGKIMDADIEKRLQKLLRVRKTDRIEIAPFHMGPDFRPQSFPVYEAIIRVTNKNGQGEKGFRLDRIKHSELFERLRLEATNLVIWGKISLSKAEQRAFDKSRENFDALRREIIAKAEDSGKIMRIKKSDMEDAMKKHRFGDTAELVEMSMQQFAQSHGKKAEFV